MQFIKKLILLIKRIARNFETSDTNLYYIKKKLFYFIIGQENSKVLIWIFKIGAQIAS